MMAPPRTILTSTWLNEMHKNEKIGSLEGLFSPRMPNSIQPRSPPRPPKTALKYILLKMAMIVDRMLAGRASDEIDRPSLARPAKLVLPIRASDCNVRDCDILILSLTEEKSWNAGSRLNIASRPIRTAVLRIGPRYSQPRRA